VGAVTFNQAYTNSPSSLVVCTACNRVDYKDRATNLGMACAYTQPPFSKSRVPGRTVSMSSLRSSIFPELEGTAGVCGGKEPLISSMSPLTSRAYVAQSRVHLPKVLPR
jgi:hypothetical protein